jgi:DNA repair ATPase RecN
MKKTFLITAFMIFGFAAMASNPIEPLSKKTIGEMTEEERNQRMEQLDARLSEINEIPLNDLERSERNELRKEVRSLQKEAKALQRAGIYISGGAILVALILLLLLL